MRWMKALAVALLCALLPAAALADGDDYAAYLIKHGAPFGDTSAVLYTSEAGDALNEGDSVTISVRVSQDTFAYPIITYQMTGDNILNNAYTLALDGALPYTECGYLTLETLWRSPNAFDIDRYGNQVLGMPEKSRETLCCGLRDKSGLYSGGMGLFLAAGEHTLTLSCREGAFTLYGVSLAAPNEPVHAPADAALNGDQIIIMQAENVLLRNNPNVRPMADGDTALTPYSASSKVINCIDEASYDTAGDRLMYAFTVRESGYYALCLRMRQSTLANLPVYRIIEIDGVIPSPAFDGARFDAASSYRNSTVTDARGEPALIYLTQGEHTLSLRSTVDLFRPAVKRMEVISDEIAALALNITKITGGNTDKYRDFDLEAFDFHIAEDMTAWIDALSLVRDDLRGIIGSDTVGALSNLDLAIKTLEQLRENPNDLPKKLNQFSQGSASARSCLINTVTDLTSSPMGLDSVMLYQDAALLPSGMTLGEKTLVLAEQFAASFGAQSYQADDGAEEGAVQVWVNRPRQYIEIMQRMADTEFTAASGIKVDFSIMPDESKLILSTASGSAPDVALGVSSGRVYDLAVRGALKNLREYEDFRRVGALFPAGMLIPGACNEGMYALPETISFNVLFYRKDILESLNLSVPDSYQDVLDMLPVLHRYGLNYNSYVANNIGYKGFNATMPYIFQCGGSLYEPGNIKTALGQEKAIAGLQLLTDSFIVYDMDFEVASFYQAFRDGTLPLGTGEFFTYNLLLNAAPELTDRWGIALYPGVKDENGVVQRWTSGAAQSGMIFSDTDMPDEAWAFLSWWMSDDVQTAFSYTLQTTMGNEYLWMSANTDAFLRSPLPAEHKRVIAEQMQWTYETPRVPGSYMVEREISNAVYAVVGNGENLRAALDEAIKRIDREVERKLEEFGWLKDGELTVTFSVPDLDEIRRWLE